VTLAIGLVAAALTVLSFLAQTAKIVKTRDTSALSTPMWLLSTAAFALWIAYGFLVSALPIIIPNLICCALAAFILALKLLPHRKRDAALDKLSPGEGRQSRRHPG
jgi:MtN3 and saliva related transmembrane protein